ncbi:unnamed protein product [Darwinula stevensoni]|uniref:Anamorsin homolog n=1 Tax=Darwinula stevensoni TaxID=69355 RepID=A0A7R9A8L2_9CRUS|nr:unnamed protein product [Darwinula stevensoni]CAG0896558.1 unnamed protein product [Darwinula stevensoni]
MAEEIYKKLQKGWRVLVVWHKLSSPESLQECVEKLKGAISDTGHISIENANRLEYSNFGASTFDAILSGIHPEDSSEHSDTLLENFLRVLKPGGLILIGKSDDSALLSKLKLNGFIDVKAEGFGIESRKPKFEVGASVPLSFGKSIEEAKNIWKLEASDAMEEDLINADDLLDEDDLKKPDPSSLRVCGTTGQRKACKDCSCGLAEELEVEKQVEKGKGGEEKKSSCGNCYLGDAFRCASCPYRGLPPFKPGEKILLSSDLLNPDV